MNNNSSYVAFNKTFIDNKSLFFDNKAESYRDQKVEYIILHPIVI